MFDPSRDDERLAAAWHVYRDYLGVAAADLDPGDLPRAMDRLGAALELALAYLDDPVILDDIGAGPLAHELIRVARAGAGGTAAR